MPDTPQRIYTGIDDSRRLGHGVQDVAMGVGLVHIWGLLGWHDIRQRYRRSLLGPLWLTISTAVMVISVGILYSKIFKQDLSIYLPFLAIGLVVWQMLATVIIESCDVFTSAGQMIKQIKVPLMVHVCRLVWRNLLIFAHNAVIIVVVCAVYLKPTFAGALQALVGLAGVVLNCLWVGMLLGVVSARYRDIAPTTASLVQVAFFLTPILWYANSLGDRIVLVYVNPFYHLVEAIRGPLMDLAGYPQSIAAVYLMALVGLPATLVFFSRYRTRVPYWV